MLLSALFQEALVAHEKVTSAAVSISEANIGVHHTGRQNRTLFVFAKLIAHNMSIMACIGKCLDAPEGNAILDHFSVGALGRIAIDAGLMTMYLSEPSLTLSGWNLRRHVLYLHDLPNRKRFLEAPSPRGAVREAKWEVAKFEFHQAYLSAHVHSHPVSFMLAEDHKISFSNPSKFQIGFCAYVLNACTEYLEDVNSRVISFSNPDIGDPLGQAD
jgi:hypothetical protein